MSPSAPAVVTFDLWHTLVYLGPRSEEEYMGRQADLAVRVLRASRPVRGLASAISARACREAFETARSDAVRASEVGRTISLDQQLTRAAEALGRVPDPAGYRRALRRELARTDFRRTPGALAALRTLHRAGYRIGLLSNTVGEPGVLLRPVLHQLGLDRDIEHAVFSDEHPWTKPAPQIFRALIRSLGGSPARTVHVGDGWSDIEGARRARLRAGIWFTGVSQYGASYRRLFAARNDLAAAARWRVERFEDLPRLIGRILPVSRDVKTTVR